MRDVISQDKLIGRDDHKKFESNKEVSEEERLKSEYESHMLEDIKGGQGGDSTLNMKNFVKSLSSLAGGDDTIFAIIDDRFDVWLQDVKNKSGEVIDKKVAENLI